jgi:hypothetical protein
MPAGFCRPLYLSQDLVAHYITPLLEHLVAAGIREQSELERRRRTEPD